MTFQEALSKATSWGDEIGGDALAEIEADPSLVRDLLGLSATVEARVSSLDERGRAVVRLYDRLALVGLGVVMRAHFGRGNSAAGAEKA
jgi:hypothetical protein